MGARSDVARGPRPRLPPSASSSSSPGRRGLACFAGARGSTSAEAKSKLFLALEPCDVYRTTGEKLRRDVKPRLDESGIKLLMVSIGSAASASEFAKGTEFPAENLFADETNNCYDALSFYSGLMRTFFDKSSLKSMQKRFSSDGAEDLKGVMKDYKMLPPKQNTQTLIQGGVICFDGTSDVFFHRDEGTGAHADFDKAIAALGA